MALFEDSFLNGWGGPVLLSLGAIAALPLLVPIVGAVIRPVTKLAIQGGMVIADTVQDLVAQGGEQINDLVAEAHAEYTTNGNGAA